MEKGTQVVVNESYSGWEWEGTYVGTHGKYYCICDQDGTVFDVEPELVSEF